MAAKKKSAGARGGKVKKVMGEYKQGTLKSGKAGKGGTVQSRKQAVAIALNEARDAGESVPRKKAASKKTARKKTASKKIASKKTASKKKK
jgi:hypothetical protein